MRNGAVKRKTGGVDVFVQYCEQQGLPTPVAEYRFHPKRKWRIDYYFEKDGKRVALEVEGGVWRYGRHNRASGFVKDMEKYNAIAVAGIFLLRVQPGKLFGREITGALQDIFQPRP